MTPEQPAEPSRIRRLFEDDAVMDEAMREVARRVRRFHKQTGRPLVVWRDGRVCHIPPEEIRVDDLPDLPN